MVEPTHKLFKWRGSVIVRLCCLAGILLLLVATVIAATLRVTRAQRADSLVINLAGRQRMLTQRFSKEVLREANPLSRRDHLTVAGDSSRRAPEQRASQKTRTLFETTAAALRYGGTTYTDPATDQTVTVHATANPRIQSKLAKVDDLWKQLQQAASGMQAAVVPIGGSSGQTTTEWAASDNSTAYREQFDRFGGLNVACLKEMDAAVRMYQADAEAKVAMLTKIHYAAGAIAILVFAAFLHLVPDITERRHAEEQLLLAHGELELKAAELEEANDELAEYAHAVSHDVMAPLRAIHNYADFLREDLESVVDAQQTAYLDGLGRAVRQGEELVHDLLELSGIGGTSSRIEAIDVGEFVRELIASLDLSPDVEIVIGSDLPTIEADRTLLRQVFQNLIANAVKFNHSDRKRVQLGWLPVTHERCELFVRDNGIGIEPRFHEQIFRIFERLHTREEYEGLRRLPVVILTTSKAEEDRLRSYDLGANAFIVKPVGFESLSQAVKTLNLFWQIVELPGGYLENG